MGDLHYYRYLNSYDKTNISGFKNIDVYGKFREEFINLVAHELGENSRLEHPFRTFSYDWRADIRDTAQKFEEYMRNGDYLKKRKIVIIAHSMGGLVFKWWYNTIYKDHEKEYDFTNISEVYFLGTPHKGAATALKNLIEGFKLSDGSNFFFFGPFKDIIQGKIFANLNLSSYDAPVKSPI